MSKTYLYRFFIFYCFINQINAKNFGLEKSTFITLIIIIIIIFIIIIFFLILIIRVNIINQKILGKKDLIKKQKVYIFQKIIIPLNKIPNNSLNLGSQCPICLDDFTPLKKVCSTPCKHIFHFKCLRKYIIETNNSNCPICKFDLLKVLDGKKINYKTIILPEKELSLDLDIQQENENFDNTNTPFQENKNHILSIQDNFNNNRNEDKIMFNKHQKIKKLLLLDEQVDISGDNTEKNMKKKQNSLIIYNKHKDNQLIMINQLMKNYTEIDNN